MPARARPERERAGNGVLYLPSGSLAVSLQACADLVARGDPARYRAAMAGPVAARRVLFPLYAFNVEVARAPWVTAEPLIAEMRLQWWRDALSEIAAGRPPRRHEVVEPLGDILDATGAALLDRLVAARRWDVRRGPHADAAALRAYLEDTAGGLVWVAARALGAEAATEPAFRAAGRAAGLARYLAAVPALSASGRQPLPDGAAEALARAALADWPRAIRRLPRPARAALTEAAGARLVLRRVLADPARVSRGRVALSPFRARLALLAMR